MRARQASPLRRVSARCRRSPRTRTSHPSPPARTVIVRRSTVPAAELGTTTRQWPAPLETLPFAGTFLPAASTRHATVPEVIPLLVSERLTARLTENGFPARGRAGGPNSRVFVSKSAGLLPSL